MRGVTAVKRVENRGRGRSRCTTSRTPTRSATAPRSPPARGSLSTCRSPGRPIGGTSRASGWRCASPGQPRWSIWQAAKGDGDFVAVLKGDFGVGTTRASGVFGVPAADGDRALVVLDDFFTLVPVFPAGSLPPYLTVIKRVDNRTRGAVTLRNVENPSGDLTIGPMQSLPADVVVPWAGRAQDFAGHHLQVRRDGATRHLALAGGEHRRRLRPRRTRRPLARRGAAQVDGVAGAGGNRTLVVVPDGVELAAQTAFGLGIGDLQALGSMGDHRLCPGSGAGSPTGPAALGAETGGGRLQRRRAGHQTPSTGAIPTPVSSTATPASGTTSRSRTASSLPPTPTGGRSG